MQAVCKEPRHWRKETFHALFVVCIGNECTSTTKELNINLMFFTSKNAIVIADKLLNNCIFLKCMCISV